MEGVARHLGNHSSIRSGKPKVLKKNNIEKGEKKEDLKKRKIF